MSALKLHVDLARGLADLALRVVGDRSAAASVLVGALTCLASSSSRSRAEATELLVSVGRQIVDIASKMQREATAAPKGMAS